MPIAQIRTVNSKCLRFANLFLVVSLIVAASACTSSSGTPTSPSSISNSTALTADALAATWRLQSIQKTGQPEQLAPAGADFTVTFTDRLSARVGCNACSSGYKINGSTLSVADAIACTRAACPTIAFETEYTAMISGDHQVTTSATTMTWVSPKGTIRFTR